MCNDLLTQIKTTANHNSSLLNTANKHFNVHDVPEIYKKILYSLKMKAQYHAVASWINKFAIT